MKIIIADDNAVRVELLARTLVEKFDCAEDDIHIRMDGQSTRDALRSVAYDLLVLDVMLPHRPGESPSEQTALDLLTEISDTDRLRKPSHIIGLTAYESAEYAASRSFLNRSWILLRENQLNDDWIMTIGNAIDYIRSKELSNETIAHDVDVAIICALQLEMDAVRRLPWNWQPDEVLDDSQFVARGSFLSAGTKMSVVTAVSNRMGMVPAAVLAAKVIGSFRPKLVAMPGICAGVRDRTSTGDVVCSDMSWDYQSGKHVSLAKALPGFLMDPHFIQTEPFISARIDNMARDDALAISTWQGWHPKYPTPPKLVRGPIASGSAVIADSEITSSVRLQQRKLVAIEMELYGIFYACEQAHRPKPMALGLKSVCDFADEEKSDSAQAYAAYTSATYLRAFCERHAHEL